jgi:hypothetical protein
MKVVIVYRPNSEKARLVEEFARDIDRQQNVQPQLVDVDSPEGIAMVSLYDIMSYPAVIVTREDGELIQYWANDQLPLMQEVAAFARG